MSQSKKHLLVKFGILLILLNGIGFLIGIPALTAEEAGEEEGKDFAFVLGELGFKYYDIVEQPVPLVIEAMALKEYSIQEIGDFYLADRMIKYTDFPEFFESLNAGDRFKRGHSLTSLEGQLLLRYLNDEVAPELAKQGFKGDFVFPTWRDMLRAQCNGKEPHRSEKPDRFYTTTANRFYEGTCWEGDDSPLPIGGSQIRRGRLVFNQNLDSLAWPFDDEREQQIFGFLHSEPNYKIEPVWAGNHDSCLVLPKFVRVKTEEAGNEN